MVLKKIKWVFSIMKFQNYYSNIIIKKLTPRIHTHNKECIAPVEAATMTASLYRKLLFYKRGRLISIIWSSLQHILQLLDIALEKNGSVQ